MPARTHPWTDALQHVPLDNLLDVDPPNTRDILDDILVHVLELYDAARERNTRFWRQNGTVVVLSDVLEKVKHRMQRCKSVIEETPIICPLDFNIPLNAVNVLLQRGSKDVSIFGSISEGLDIATKIMVQYFVLELLHLANTSENPCPNILLLKESITAVYVMILDYFDRAIKFGSAGTIELSKSTTTKDMELRSQSLQKEISGTHTEAMRLALLMKPDLVFNDPESSQRQLIDLFDDLQGPVVRMPNDIWQIEDDLETYIRQEFLDWLSTVPSSAHLQHESDGILHGTGDWLLQHPDFRAWQDSSISDIFWMSGIPGSGKSKLTAKVAQYCLSQDLSATKNRIPFAFFECSQKGDDKRQNSPREVLLSILRQLSGRSPNLPLRGDLINEYIRKKDALKDKGGFVPRLTEDEAIAQVLSITEVVPVIIVIDALDETSKEQRYLMLEALNKIISSSVNVVKIFVSSRRDVDIVSALGDFSSLSNVEDLNQKDIDTFIDYELDRNIKTSHGLGKPMSKLLRDDIASTLSAKAQGMFRWVELSLSVLFKPQTVIDEDNIRSSLGTLPSSLQEQYQLIYDDIMESSLHRAGVARRIFAWVLAAQRPMSTTEYVAAVSIDEKGDTVEGIDAEVILEVTRNFLRETSLAKSDGIKTLQVVHLSVREFLEEVNDLSPKEVHGIALQRCLYELHGKNNESMRHLRDQLQPYSKYLFEHARRTSLGDTCSDFTNLMLRFLWNADYDESHLYKQWITLFKEHEDYQFKQRDELSEDDRLYIRTFSFSRMCIPAINLVCKYGLLAILHQLPVERVYPWTYDPNIYSTPALYEATTNGEYESARWILANDICPADEGVKHVTALFRAAWDGNESIVRLLLAHGADPFWGADTAEKFTQTPLCMGFSTPLAIANKKDGNSTVDKTGTIRAMIDHIEEQRFTVPERLSDLNFDWRAEALYQALQTDQESIASLLLERVSGLNYRTSVSSKSVNQIRYWLERRRFYIGEHSPNKPINPSLLHVAVYGSKPLIVEKVLERCLAESRTQSTRLVSTTADSISKNDKAPRPTSPKALDSFQNDTSGINVQDGLGRTPLHYLMDREKPGVLQILDMLVKAGADMSAVSDQGIVAIHIAAAIGASDIVQKLVDNDINVSALDNSGANALHYTALGDGSQSVIESLLQVLTSNGLSLTARDHHGNTAIHYAAAANNIAFLGAAHNLFVTQGRNFSAAEHIFSPNDQQQVDKTGDPTEDLEKTESVPSSISFATLKNDEGQTPLHIVHTAPGRDSVTNDEPPIKHKDQAVVRFLISIGAQVNAQDSKGCTPLMRMITKFSASVPAIEELRCAGARTDVTDTLGRTVMHYAALNTQQDEAKLKLLIDYGVAVDAQDHFGDTPLHHAACSYQNVRAIGLLVRNGAPVNACSSLNTTPLHYATYANVIEILVRNGAELEVRDNQGRTPLFVVLEKDSLYEHIRKIYKEPNDPNHLWNKKRLIECLIKHGADPTVCDDSGRSVLSLAEGHDSPEIKDLVVSAIEKWTPIASEWSIMGDDPRLV